MLGQEGYVEIHVMHRHGMSIKAIGRELGLSRNTVRKYLRAAQVPRSVSRSAKPTKLDDYRAYLNDRVAAAHPDWIPSTVLFDEIVALGYSGGGAVFESASLTVTYDSTQPMTGALRNVGVRRYH